ncbi:hypothetical protein [Neobacillus citreus]|nr:hypothetical protein [Neobacillus citreus]
MKCPKGRHLRTKLVKNEAGMSEGMASSDKIGEKRRGNVRKKDL